jgi:hypothetical protein
VERVRADRPRLRPRRDERVLAEAFAGEPVADLGSEVGCTPMACPDDSDPGAQSCGRARISRWTSASAMFPKTPQSSTMVGRDCARVDVAHARISADDLDPGAPAPLRSLALASRVRERPDRTRASVRSPRRTRRRPQRHHCAVTLTAGLRPPLSAPVAPARQAPGAGRARAPCCGQPPMPPPSAGLWMTSHRCPSRSRK